MKLTPLIFLCLSLIFLSSPSMAMDLDTARSQNLVVEKPTGFIEAKDPKAKDLVVTINNQRRQAYEKVAKKTRTSVDVVGAQAHKKIMEKLEKQ